MDLTLSDTVKDKILAMASTCYWESPIPELLLALGFPLGLFGTACEIVARTTPIDAETTILAGAEGLCIRRETHRCCKDYYKQNNVCIECPMGTHGINCSDECPAGFYGRKCLSKCTCGIDEICKSAEGCVHIVYKDRRNECINGSCKDQGIADGTKTTRLSVNGGTSDTTIIVITVVMMTILLIMAGLLIKRTIRSPDENILGSMCKVFYRQRSRAAEENGQRMPENLNDNEGEFVYDGIRLSRMVPDCAVACGTTAEKCNKRIRSRYQDPSFLLPKRMHRDEAEYSRRDKVKSNVYDHLSQRSGFERDGCEYDSGPFSQDHQESMIENKGAYGGGCHSKSLAVCREENESEVCTSEISDPVGLMSHGRFDFDGDNAIERTVNESKSGDKTCSGMAQEEIVEGQYYILEKADSKTSKPSK